MPTPGLTFKLPVAFTDATLPKLPVVLASDSFNRADTAAGNLGTPDNAYGGSATAWELDVNISVYGNKWRCNGQSTNRSSRMNVGTTDHKVKATWHLGAAGLIARYTDNSNFYRLVKGNVGLELYRTKAGASTTLMGPGPAIVAGDTIALQLQGSVVTVYKNDAVVWTFTDVDPLTTGTRAGLRSDFASETLFDDIIITNV